MNTMPSSYRPYRHRNGVFARYDNVYHEYYRRLARQRKMKEMNDQNSSINGIMESLQDHINGELSPQKNGSLLDGGPDTGPMVNESALNPMVDANNPHINSLQQNDYSNGATNTLLQTIINASQGSRESHPDNCTGKGPPGSLDSPFALPNLHEFNGALQQQNGEVQPQQSPAFVINSPNSKVDQQGQGLSGVDQNFSHTITTESANDFQSFLMNQNANTDLHVITENHLNQGSAHMGNLPTFEGLAQINTKAQDSPECLTDKQPVLERLLTDQKMTDTTRMSQSIASPDFQSTCSPTSSSNSPYTEGHGQDTSFMDPTSQGLTYTEMAPISIDTSTQSSLIARSEKLVLVDSPFQGAVMDHQENNIEWSVTKIDDHELEQIGKPKMMKIGHDNDVPSSVLSPSVERVFDVDSAMQGVTSEFTFHKFGQGDADQGFFHFGPEKKDLEGPSSPPTFKTPHPPGYGARKREQARRSREPILSQQFPSRHQNYELKILSQPEEQHRARYLTEGSRGSVKNRGGQGYPSVKLLGHGGEATLQVFIGNDSGRVRPHGFYQACKVCGKNSTPCSERDIDGTTVIEIDLKKSNDMTASIDCVGILKLRNADVEQRIGIAKAKKKSTKARMVFRVTFQKPCGSPQVLQVASAPILCTQPIGQPEICKMSLRECVSSGGEELFIIGKNFLRGTRVYFQEVNEEDKVLWEGEGEIDKDYFQTTHLIVTIPEYTRPLQPGTKSSCQVVANSGGKVSDAQTFTYISEDKKIPVKQEVPMDTAEESRKRNYPFVAPEALELNQQIQQVSKSSDMFQIPPGVMSGVMQQQQQQQQVNSTNNTLTEMDDGTLQRDNKAFQMPQLPDTGNDPDHLNLNSVRYSVDTNVFNPDANTNVFSPDTIVNTPTQTWDSKPVEPSKGFTSMESETTEGLYPPMNTEESYTDQTFESSLNRIKSPRLSTDTFQTDHALSTSMYTGDSVSMNSATNISTSESNMISQLLQNLQNSEPTMMSTGSQEQVTSQESGSLFTSGPNTTGASKVEDQSCSRLKEALTCPASSLQEFSNFGHIANPNLAVAQSSAPQNCDSEMKVDDESKDTLNLSLNSNLTLCPNANGAYNPSQSVFAPDQTVPSPSKTTVLQSSYSQQEGLSTSISVPTVSNPSVFTSPGLVNNSSNGNTPDINQQLSQLLSNVNSSQLQSPLQNVSIHTGGTQLHVSQPGTTPSTMTGSQSQQIFHNQTVSFPPTQQQQLQAQNHLSQSSQSIVINTASYGGTNSTENSSGTSLNAIQQLLQQSVHQSVQQQPQISQQMGANQIGVLHTAQTKIVPSPQAELQAQPIYPTQGSFTTTAAGSGDISQQQQVPQPQQPALQLLNQQPTQQEAQQPFTPCQSSGFPMSAQPKVEPTTPVSAPNASNPSMSPQIIICNPGQQASQPTSGFGGSPSIVIMPAQNGQNNQVENLLRSILGSMMGQPQQQQQQQQQQPPTNQQ